MRTRVCRALEGQEPTLSDVALRDTKTHSPRQYRAGPYARGTLVLKFGVRGSIVLKCWARAQIGIKRAKVRCAPRRPLKVIAPRIKLAKVRCAPAPLAKRSSLRGRSKYAKVGRPRGPAGPKLLKFGGPLMSTKHPPVANVLSSGALERAVVDVVMVVVGDVEVVSLVVCVVDVVTVVV